VRACMRLQRNGLLAKPTRVRRSLNYVCFVVKVLRCCECACMDAAEEGRAAGDDRVGVDTVHKPFDRAWGCVCVSAPAPRTELPSEPSWAGPFLKGWLCVWRKHYTREHCGGCPGLSAWLCVCVCAHASAETTAVHGRQQLSAEQPSTGWPVPQPNQLPTTNRPGPAGQRHPLRAAAGHHRRPDGRVHRDHRPHHQVLRLGFRLETRVWGWKKCIEITGRTIKSFY
jgi:hypothetical protein